MSDAGRGLSSILWPTRGFALHFLAHWVRKPRANGDFALPRASAALPHPPVSTAAEPRPGSPSVDRPDLLLFSGYGGGQARRVGIADLPAAARTHHAGRSACPACSATASRQATQGLCETRKGPGTCRLGLNTARRPPQRHQPRNEPTRVRLDAGCGTLCRSRLSGFPARQHDCHAKACDEESAASDKVLSVRNQGHPWGPPDVEIRTFHAAPRARAASWPMPKVDPCDSMALSIFA